MNELIAKIASDFERQKFYLEGKGDVTGKQLREMGFMYDTIRFEYLIDYLDANDLDLAIADCISKLFESTFFKSSTTELKVFVALICSHINISPEVIITSI